MSAFAHLEPQRRLVALFLFLSAATLLQALMPTQQAFAQCDCIVWAGSYDLCELPDGVNPLVPCSSGCDSDFDGDVDKDDLRSFIDDSAECADHGGPPPLDWLKAVIDYFIGHCGGCPGFNIDIEDIIGLIGEYYPGPIPPELIDHFNDLLPPPGEIEPPATEPSEPPEIDDPGDDDNGGGGGDDGDGSDDPGPGDGNMPGPPGIWPGLITGGGGSTGDGDQGGGGEGDASGDGPEDGATCATLETANTTSGSPVHLFEGDKLEQVVDLTVALPGRNFELVRSYNGSLDISPYGMVGNGWTLSVFSHVFHPLTDDEPPEPDTDFLYVAGRDGHSVQKFELDGGSGRYLSTTGSSYIKKELRDWGSDTYAVWTLVVPGKVTAYYFRTPDELETSADEINIELVGALWQEVDTYQHVWTFGYDITTYDNEPSEYEGSRRLKVIRLNDTLGYPQARVSFSWIKSEDEDLPVGVFYGVNGRLVMAQVERRVDSAWVQTAYVTYFHKPGDDTVGTIGDLIEVRTGVRVDSNAVFDTSWEPWQERGTHYRYHTAQEPPTEPEDERFAAVGARHQLRAVILPEQVEWLAARMCESEVTTPAFAIKDALAALNGVPDDGDAWIDGMESLTPFDLSAKIVGYDVEGRVSVQYVQTGCGCAGTAHGLKQEFTYVDLSGLGPYGTTIMQEYSHELSGYELFRTTYVDMKKLGDIPYMVNRVVEDSRSGADTEGDRWVWHYEYDEVERRLEREFYPSATSSYTLADSMALWEYEARAEGGLVYEYGYNSNGMRDSIAVRSADGTTFETIRETDYSTELALGRTDIPVEVREFTVAGTSNAAEIQKTEYQYALYDTGDPNKGIKWVKVIAEAEATTENGPGGTYTSVTLYDEDGHEFWTKRGDGSLIYREFDPLSGMITKIVYNADVEEPGGDIGADLTANEHFDTLSPGGWGRFAEGGSLIEESVYDAQGRIKEWTSTSGVKRYTRYEVAPVPTDLTGIAYARTVELPHQLLDDSFVAPAAIGWRNAAGRLLYASQWLITADPYEPLEDDGFDYDTEVARAVTHYSLRGAVESRRVWHDVASNASYESTYEYDPLGRVISSVSPSGTMTFNTKHDVFDRVLEVKVGTDELDAVTVAEYYYDAAPGVAAQGIGDGNLTMSRVHVDDAPSYRDVQRQYDHRNRLQWVVPPLPPYEYYEYDNLDRVVTRSVFSDVTEDLPDTTEDDRHLYERTYYSQRGLAYKQIRAINSQNLGGIASGTFLGTWTWFDAEGRAIKVFAPNSPIIKRTYDGFGRAVATYLTDGGGDGGVTGMYSHAETVTGDRVVEQVKSVFADSDGPWPGELLLTTTWRRLHDATETGELTATGGTPTAVATYVGFYYDDANRPIRTVNFGSNASADVFEATTAPTWPPYPLALPTYVTHANTIISAVAYDNHGRAFESIDPQGRITRTLFDDLGRRIAVIENYEDATVSWNVGDLNWEVANLDRAEPDKDRVTTFAYDSTGGVWKQTAHLPDPDPMAAATDVVVQVTEYVRDESVGTTYSAIIVSNNLLHEVRYPDESTGAPGSTDAYKVKYTYNRLGEIVKLIDQNGTEHTYTRDEAGRVIADVVSDLGTDIDDAIQRIGTSFDDLGRVDRITSYANTTGTQVRNEVMYAYDDLWRVQAIYQNPIDEVTTAGLGAPAGETQWVRYYYEDEYVHDEDENYSRLVKIRYPDKPSAAAEETELLINYGADNGLDDLISRPIDLKVSNHNGTTEDTIVSYSWVGMGMASIVNYQLVGAELGQGLQLDRTLSYNPVSSLDVGSRRFASYTTTPRGTYPGWDRFGRTLAQAWVDGVLDVHASNDDFPNRPPVVLETYSYDRSSNPLTRLDARYGAHLGNRDFAFAYDGLDRLTESDRGNASTWGQTGTQEWTLDMLGNWATFRWDRNGDGDFTDGNETDVRAHNSANEIDDRTLEYPSPVSDVNAPVTYDDAGNVRLRYETGTTRLELTHDAWNRLVKVRRITGNIEDPPLDVSRHEYNGLHWRIMSVEDTDTPRDGELDQRRAYFYSASWQVLEEWVEVAHDPDPYEEGLISDYRMQQFWGLRHVDDAVMLRRQEETGEDAGDFTRVSFQLTDRQFSVVAVVDESGMLMERVVYDPYGRAQHRWPGDFNGDGYANSTDTGALSWYEQIGDVDYLADEDLDRSGEIDLDDLIIAVANWSGRGPLTGGQISDPEGPANRVGYAGYRFEPSSALYHVRFRWYDIGLGRWMERDPLGLVPCMNMYDTLNASPLGWNDHLGLAPYKDSHDTQNPRCKKMMRRHYYDEKGGYVGYVDWDTTLAGDEARADKIGADGTLLNTVRSGAGTAEAVITTGGLMVVAAASVVTPGPEDLALAAFAGSKLVKVAGKWIEVAKDGTTRPVTGAVTKELDKIGGTGHSLRQTKNQAYMTKRGWAEDDIARTLANPKKKRNSPVGDKANNCESATEYYCDDQNWITVNDRTGEIIMVSDRNNPNFKPYP